MPALGEMQRRGHLGGPMKIEFVWRRKGEENSATALAGPISASPYVRVALRPIPPKIDRRRIETDHLQHLTFEAPCLSHQIPRDGDNPETDICAQVSWILDEFRNRGLDVWVLIDGWTLQQYAAQQETLARRNGTAMKEAVQMLKETRSWFKDSRLASIRRNLEAALQDRD